MAVGPGGAGDDGDLPPLKRRQAPPKRTGMLAALAVMALGAAVAVETALRRPLLGLILESPFPSVPDMARRVYPFVPSVAWRALRTRYDAEAKIASVRVPLLVIHGDSDEIVPPEEGRRVYDAAPEPKGLHVIPGAGHNDTYVLGGESYFDALRRFIEGL